MSRSTEMRVLYQIDDTAQGVWISNLYMSSRKMTRRWRRICGRWPIRRIEARPRRQTARRSVCARCRSRYTKAPPAEPAGPCRLQQGGQSPSREGEPLYQGRGPITTPSAASDGAGNRPSSRPPGESQRASTNSR